MKRSRFLIAVVSVCAAASAPRLATATAGGRVRLVRRYGCAPAPGRCADQRARRRWSSFTAADFHGTAR
jgi:hypothetical protein